MFGERHPINQLARQAPLIIWAVTAVVLAFPVTAGEVQLPLELPSAEQLDYYSQVITAETEKLKARRHADNRAGEVDALHADDRAGEVDALLHRAEAYAALGHDPKALSDLEQAVDLARKLKNDRRRLASALGARGSVRSRQGETESAKKDLKESRENAQDFPEIAAATLINWGNLKAEQDLDLWGAAQDYDEAARLAITAGRPDVAASAYLNAGRVYLQDTFFAGNAPTYVAKAEAQIQQTVNSRQRASYLIALATLWRDLARINSDATVTPRIKNALDEALDLAKQTGDRRTQSIALAHLGRWQEDAKEIKVAVKLTRQALFHAQALGARELEYQWQGQLGRLLNAKGDTEKAKAAYRDAIVTFQRVQQDLASAGGRTDPKRFRQLIDPIFAEYVDLLLAETRTAQRDKAPNALEPLQKAFVQVKPAEAYTSQNENPLIQTQKTFDRVKSAELQNYFQDQCVAELEAKKEKIDTQYREPTAILYSIVLPNRLVLLLELPDRSITPFIVRVGREELDGKVERFWKDLSSSVQDKEQEYGKEFYQLLAPALAAIPDSVKAIAFIPDGALGLIPLTALYDPAKQQYLIDRFAVATLPGLTLIEPGKPSPRDLHLLAAGLTIKVDKYEPLRYVDKELQELQKLAGGEGEVLKGGEFTSERLNAALGPKPFSIVHIASHAEFGDKPENTFIVTAGEKLSMNKLEELIKPRRFRNQPIELITLSACKTATGNERTALGLAGVALKSGARGALATLWQVDDEATYKIATYFYNNLVSNNTSKAKALQNAQQQFIKNNPAKSDPFYWAAFVLIGNWL